MIVPDALAVVRAWQAAVNARDEDRLLALSDPEIEIVGPRGVARGHDVLRQWLAHAGLNFESKREFARGGDVVVEQYGVWRSVETGEVVGEADVASVFHVAGGRLARYARFDTVDEALEAAGLTRDDGSPGA